MAIIIVEICVQSFQGSVKKSQDKCIKDHYNYQNPANYSYISFAQINMDSHSFRTLILQFKKMLPVHVYSFQVMSDMTRVSLHQSFQIGRIEPVQSAFMPVPLQVRMEAKTQSPTDQCSIFQSGQVVSQRVKKLRLQNKITFSDRHGMYQQKHFRLLISSLPIPTQIRAMQFLPWQKYTFFRAYSFKDFLFTGSAFPQTLLSSDVEALEEDTARQEYKYFKSCCINTTTSKCEWLR